MSGQFNPQLAVEVPVQAGSLPYISWDPRPKPPVSPEIAEKIERFNSLFHRSRFDASLYGAPVSIVTPAMPEILTTIDFVRDYPQQDLASSLMDQIIASQSHLAAYRTKEFGWSPGNPFDHVTSRYTGLPVFVSAGVAPFDLNEDAAQQEAGKWLTSNYGVITGLDSQPQVGDLNLVQVQGIPTTGQPADIVHVYYQQRLRGYPIYGAQVALHMAAGDGARKQRPAFATSSFFPIPDIQFAQPIEAQKAISDAEQALAAWLSGPDALRPLGEALAGPAGAEISARLENFAAARDAALQAKDLLAAEFTGADPALRGRGLPELLNRAWNRQEGQVWTAPAWWNKAQFPAAVPDSVLIGDLLAPPRLNHHDLLSMAPPDLQPWLEQPATAAPPIALQQLKAFDDARVAATHALAQVRDWLADSHAPGEDQASLAAVIETWAERDEMGSPLWETHIAHYEDSELMILPYDGRYYLVYLVELLTPARDEGWRVFVNAESGAAGDERRIIGPPERLSMHFDMRVYPSSQAVLDGVNQRRALNAEEVTTIDSDLSLVARLAFHPDAGGKNFTMQVLRSDGGLPQSKHDEGMNLAFHAHKMYGYLLGQCRVDPADLFQWYRATNAPEAPPPLTIQAGMGGTTLTTGFVPSVGSSSGTISFQTAPADGLTGEEGKKVYLPSLDPELIYHEMAHGLMWLLNRVPFDSRYDSVPFGRALLEGYANYLARSLAARTDPGTGQWARASYRDGDWHQRWSVAIQAAEPQAAHAPSQSEVGLRCLPAPNCYPEVKPGNLAVYDVGMIWTRALWDIRTYLSQQPDVGDGVALADYLAIQSYRCVLGWSPSFEAAAEGLIAAARNSPQIAGLPAGRPGEIVKKLQDKLMARGILAERGIQAIGLAAPAGNQRWLVGADSGLRVSADPKQPWGNWQQVVTNGGNALPGVTDLLVDGNQVHIATELGIYRWDAASGALVADKVGADELAADMPRCLAIVRGQLVVGTNRTLWRFDTVTQTWQPWTPVGVELKLMVSRIMTATVGGRDFCLVAAPKRVHYAELNAGAAAAPNWRSVVFQDNHDKEVQPGWITGLCMDGPTLYTATLGQGIWKIQLSTPAAGSLDARIAPAPMSGSIGMGKVLRLIHADNSKLYAGATTGMFEFDLQAGAASWTRVAGSPPAIATVVCHVAGAVAVGTALSGLWIQRPKPGGDVEEVAIDTNI